MGRMLPPYVTFIGVVGFLFSFIFGFSERIALPFAVTLGIFFVILILASLKSVKDNI